MVLLITQNTMEKYQNTLKCKVYFFFLSFLRLKPLFACILKLKKPGHPCKKNYLFARKKIKN